MNSLRALTLPERRFLLVSVTGLIALFQTWSAWPAFGAPALRAPNMVMVDSSHLTWKPLGGVPAGAQIAVLRGDPAKGPADLLLQIPADYLFPHHFHSGPELIVSLKGSFTYISHEGKTRDFDPGSYLYLPGGNKHSVRCTGPDGCLMFLQYDRRFNMHVLPEPSSTSP